MEFVVVKMTCAHNLILGRPGLAGLGGFISMEHLCLKFHTAARVGIVEGDQHMARRCYSTACERLVARPLPVHIVEPVKEKSTRPKPAVELEEIPFHPSRPDRCVQIGRGLTPELREQVMAVLRAYSVVFAWGPEDMPGIDRSIITHKLAVNPNF